MSQYLDFIDFGTGELVRSFSAGETHNCVILVSGNVKCFGKKNDLKKMMLLFTSIGIIVNNL